MEKNSRIKRILNFGKGANPFYHPDYEFYEFGKEMKELPFFC